jgi:hypothetical protein
MTEIMRAIAWIFLTEATGQTKVNGGLDGHVD